MTTVDGNSVEDTRNFPKAPGVITFVRNRAGRGGGYLDLWYHLFEAKDMFPEIRVFELGLPKLKKNLLNSSQGGFPYCSISRCIG